MMAFSFRAGTNWCHDFPKIARESGFHFNMHRTRVRVDWNRIGSIDIERVIGERDFLTIDDNVNNIVDCCLESEYDVKILEPNFVKLFRLAQLAVEYLLYCKQYLDQSVMILKDELRSKLEENGKLKKQLEESRSTERYRVVEKKYNDSHGEIHKCPQCPKTFVSEVFMNAHVDRRHPQSHTRLSYENSPVHKRYLAETEKLHDEIKTLKERLNRTERVIRNESEKCVDTESFGSDSANDREKGSNEGRLDEGRRRSRDNDEERYRRYRQEIRQLKALLLGEIRNLKLDDSIRCGKEETDENFKELVRRQEKEIERLRDQLQKRLTPDIEGIHAKLENQEDFWQSKIDNLEARHRLDMEKLYSQLKVSRESVNEMRLDYMSKINDLEWRSRSESTLVRERILRSERCSSEAPIGNINENNHSVREKRQRQDDERIRNDSKVQKKTDDISEVADNASRKSMIKPFSPQILRVNESADKATLMPTDKDRNKRKNRLEGSKNSAITKLKESCDARQMVTEKSSTRAVEQQETQSSLDSGDCTTTEDTVQGRRSANRTATSAEKCNGKNIEDPRVSSSDESLDDSEATVESQTEDTDESQVDRNETDDNDRSDEVSIEQRLNSKLRELGIDPEWQAIPNGSFVQIMETISHLRNLNSKKYRKFDEIRHKIIQQVAQAILSEAKGTTIDRSPKRSNFEKIVTNVKMKASRALRILEKNEGSRRSIEAGRAERINSTAIKKLPRPEQRIPDQTSRETVLRRAVPRRPIVSNISVGSTNDLKHSYESIRDFVRDTNRKLVTSTPRRNDAANFNLSDSMPSLLSSPKNNSKGVLKLTSAPSGSYVKKKVLFDLEDEISPTRKQEEKNPPVFGTNELPKNDSPSTVSDISSNDSRDEVHVDNDQTPQSGSIVLKTRQSEKIAEISRQIEKQLSIPREKPVGAVEAMFMDKFASKRDNNDESRVSAYRSSRSPQTRQFETKTSADTNFPQAAPRISHYFNAENKDTNLDRDIDELLAIQ